MNWTAEEVNKVISLIKERSATDKEFRKRVLSEPQKAIKEISGKDLPQGFKIKIIENKPGVDQTYVLPDFTGEELSDEDLDNVAGGKGSRGRCDDFKGFGDDELLG
jgi:hypothetical protein